MKYLLTIVVDMERGLKMSASHGSYKKSIIYIGINRLKHRDNSIINVDLQTKDWRGGCWEGDEPLPDTCAPHCPCTSCAR